MNIDPLQPAGLSLSELLCCVLTDGGSGNSFNKPWTNMLRKDALTLSDLLETLRERNLKNVEGMVKLKI